MDAMAIRRIATLEEVAATIGFLAGPDAGYIADIARHAWMLAATMTWGIRCGISWARPPNVRPALSVHERPFVNGVELVETAHHPA
jgi:hypothetical protein